MQSKVSVQLHSEGTTWFSAVLTDEHSSSSYGLPVVLVDGEPFGVAEVACVRVPAECDPELLDAGGSGRFLRRWSSTKGGATMSIKHEHRQLILDIDRGVCLGWYMRHDERDIETDDLVNIAVDTPCDGTADQTCSMP